LILVGAQFVGMPLSLLVNAVMGRHLGPSDFGYVYLATTFATFGYLFVDWGHSGVLPAAVAQNHGRAGVLLGSSLVWRLGSSVLVSVALALVAHLLGYPAAFQPVLALISLQWFLGAINSAYQDVARGFERTDVAALGRIGQQLLMALLVIPTLLAGGGLLAVVVAQAAAAALVLPLVVGRSTRSVGIGRPSFDRNELTGLTRSGWSFLVFSIAMTLQGNVDAVSLSKLASPEVVGWHAAAQRLTGILLVPAGALIASLYPTLARLVVEDMAQFRQTVRRSINGTAIVAIPLALCCALYPEVGVSLYSQKSFGPAEQNLMILSVMVLLIYFSMPLGSALLAAGRQSTWAWAQSGCVVVRLVLNPLLIPWFQERYGNGGLGVCVSAVFCEVILVLVALFMIPGGVADRELGKSIGKAALAGGAMALTAVAFRNLTPWIVAPSSVVVYGATLWLVGGIDKVQLQRVIDGVQRKLGRKPA
jgi:O-antigen/teichoic acid export membrane protein